MKPQCHICNTPSDFLMQKDGFDLYKCSKCSLVFVYPQPSKESLAQTYYSYESGYQSNRAENLTNLPETTRAKTVLNYLQLVKPNTKILDVGCSGGHFLHFAQKRGFDVYGVEVNRRTAESAQTQGFPVFIGFLENAPLQKHSFDIVYLGEIIEHVNNPRELVHTCATLLSPGGLLVVTTPNLDCVWSRSTFFLYMLFKIPWSSVTPPYHLFQFNSSNLDLFLSAEKFQPIAQHYLLPPHFTYELGSLHLMKRFKKSRSVFDFLFMIFAFFMYAILYVASVLLHPFVKKDFSMIKVYQAA